MRTRHLATVTAGRRRHRRTPTGSRSKPALGPLRVRRGFTLVEMLVAVALVVLILSMFAQIYGIAGSAVSNQKGIAENDQRARTLTTLLRSDVGLRTFRDVIPFADAGTHGDYNTAGPLFDADRRRGYFSISENDPGDPTDDVLALTIDTANIDEIVDVATDHPPLFGKAVLLRDPATLPPPPTNEDYLVNVAPNQPEHDDGQVQFDSASGAVVGLLNETGVSRTAEVVYFLRHGKLYRRVMLIRERYDDPSSPGTQPADLTGPDYANHTDDPVSGDTPTGSGEFWRDFDYSAFYHYDDMGPQQPRFHFNGFDATSGALTNDDLPGLFGPTPEYPFSLGIPHLRFGYNPEIGSAGEGMPREFLAGPDGQPGDAGVDDNVDGVIDNAGDFGAPGWQATDDVFIGRFTMQETSHSDFDYPGVHPAIYNPYTDTTLSDGSPADGVVDQFADETFRRGEDVVLNNVHAFDIKVWDEGVTNNPAGTFVPQFIDLGHNDPDGGDYNATENQNAGYGNRYDTWHPNDALDSSLGPAPYRPVWQGIDGQPGVASDPSINTLGALGSDDEVPLKAIQITIRYYDVSSDQMRQITLVHSLVD